MQQVSSHLPQLPANSQHRANIKRRVYTQNNNSHQTVEEGRAKDASDGGSRASGLKKRHRSSRLDNGRKYTLSNEKGDGNLPIDDDDSDLQTSQIDYSTVGSKLQFKTQKDEQLYKLKSRNQMLKQQIYKFQKLQSEQASKHRHRNEHNIDQLYFAFSTKDSLAKELDNAYMKIRRMEEQIQELRRLEAQDEQKKIAGLKERVEQVDRVKGERMTKLDGLKKSNKKAEEKINEYRNGGGFKETIKELLRELDLLKDRQKEMNESQTKNKEKIKKQQEYIRKLQKQLAESGVSREFIQDIMNRVMYGIDRAKEKEKVETVHVTRKESQEQMRKEFKKAEHEIGVLRKSIKEQERVLQELVAQEKVVMARSEKMRLQYEQLEQEIAKAESDIIEVRKTINPTHLKPKPLPPKQPSLQDQKKQQQEHLRQVRKKFQQKKTKKYLKGLQNMEDQTNEFNQVDKKSQKQFEVEQKIEIEKLNESNVKINEPEEYKINEDIDLEEKKVNIESFQVFGEYSSAGIQFSDKAICDEIGEEDCQITGFTVLLSPKTNCIMGVKAQYNYKYESPLHQLQPITTAPKKKAPQQEQFLCVQEQYIVSITGTFSSQKVLTNLTVLTSLNRYHKFGSVLTARGQKGSTQFEISNEVGTRPVYIVGCVDGKGVCQFGAKVVSEPESVASSQGDN